MRTIVDRLIFLIEESFVSLRRNILVALAAVSTAAMALALFGAFTWFAYGLNNFTSTWPEIFDVVVYMNTDASPENISATESRIRAIHDVNTIGYQTKDQNWTKFQVENKEKMGDLSDIPNPLTDTFSFKVSKLNRSDVIAAAIKRMPGVEKVQYLQKEQRTVLRIIQIVRVTGAAVSTALMLVAMLLIYNAIRLTVVARRREIMVMQLVGASASTIRIPFVLEAVYQGVLGGIIASLILWAVVQPIPEVVNNLNIPGIHLVLTAKQLWVVLGGLSLCGGLAGCVCGILAVHRFLRV
ncbi:MAG: permease-like cell division protein FtsX [bacterium]|jgi:cell division transport system permease protein